MYISGTCSEGHYCGSGSSSSQENECPAGTYSNILGAYSISQCLECEQGKYSTAGSTVCLNCPSGKYSGSSDGITCTICPAGYYCEEGSEEPIPCGVGYYSNDGDRSCTISQVRVFNGD